MKQPISSQATKIEVDAKVFMSREYCFILVKLLLKIHLLNYFLFILIIKVFKVLILYLKS